MVRNPGESVTLTGEWRTNGEFDAVLIVDQDRTVREALLANPEILSSFLTETGDFHAWGSGRAIEREKRTPEAWGELVMARAQTGEVITMDPQRFWDGIYTWFRSRGVDYDGGRR